MAEFRDRCPCLSCRKGRANFQPAGHIGVDYAQSIGTPIWIHDADGYIHPQTENTTTSNAVWDMWERDTPIFHQAVLDYNAANWKSKQAW